MILLRCIKDIKANPGIRNAGNLSYISIGMVVAVRRVSNDLGYPSVHVLTKDDVRQEEKLSRFSFIPKSERVRHDS